MFTARKEINSIVHLNKNLICISALLFTTEDTNIHFITLSMTTILCNYTGSASTLLNPARNHVKARTAQNANPGITLKNKCHKNLK